MCRIAESDDCSLRRALGHAYDKTPSEEPRNRGVVGTAATAEFRLPRAGSVDGACSRIAHGDENGDTNALYPSGSRKVLVFDASMQ